MLEMKIRTIGTEKFRQMPRIIAEMIQEVAYYAEGEMKTQSRTFVKSGRHMSSIASERQGKAWEVAPHVVYGSWLEDGKRKGVQTAFPGHHYVEKTQEDTEKNIPLIVQLILNKEFGS